MHTCFLFFLSLYPTDSYVPISSCLYFTTSVCDSYHSLNTLTHYTLNFIFYKSFWGYWYLAWAVSSLQGSWPLPCPLISKLTMVRALRPVNTSPDWKLPTLPEMEPLNKNRKATFCTLFNQLCVQRSYKVTYRSCCEDHIECLSSCSVFCTCSPVLC